MMLQRSLLSRQLVLLNNCGVTPQSKLLTNLMVRSFYYPDANHHHLNQEVNKTISINNPVAYCVG